MAPSCNKAFADSYMLLSPQDARFFDLARLLCSRDLKNRKFVETHAEGSREESLRRRWLIFVSIVLQKFMLLVAKPLASFGSFVEMFINLIALNGGIFMIILNFLTGLFYKFPTGNDSLIFFYYYIFFKINTFLEINELRTTVYLLYLFHLF